MLQIYLLVIINSSRMVLNIQMLVDVWVRVFSFILLAKAYEESTIAKCKVAFLYDSGDA